jgi:hypothetical protein
MVTGGYALADAMYRFFYGCKPIDQAMFWMDVVVIVVSIAGLVITWLAWKRYGLRKRRMDIGAFVERGRQLLCNLPYGSADTPAWIEAVESFARDVVTYLEKKSKRAVGTFLDTSDMPLPINTMIAVEIRVTHAMLAHYLRNLRSIMENAEAYF